MTPRDHRGGSAPIAEDSQRGGFGVSSMSREITKRRVWDSNPRGSSRLLAIFKTAAIGH